MSRLVIYIHGKGGNAKEAEHYKLLFPKNDVIGLITGHRIHGKQKENFRISMTR